MLKISHGYKLYKQANSDIVALNNINLTICQPCFVAIVGHSGSGKSTLLSVLAGYEKLDKGYYCYQDKQFSRFSTQKKNDLYKRDIGFIFQNHQIIEELNMMDNLKLINRYSPNKVSLLEIEQCCKELGIQECLKRKVNELSIGQLQRFGIARIILQRKKLILADEPTGALDQTNSQLIMNIFTNLYTKGTSIIFVTHDRQLAKQAKTIIELENGSVII